MLLPRSSAITTRANDEKYQLKLKKNKAKNELIRFVKVNMKIL